MADTHRNVGLHAVSLASGQPVGTADTCTPDLDDTHDKALVDDGVLIPVDPGKKTRKED